MKAGFTFFILLAASQLFASKPIHIVFLAGQSNMAGSGSYMALSEADQARAMAASSRVWLSRKGGPALPLSYETSQYQLEKRGFAEIFGPELFIGITLAEANPEQEYLLIKYTQGGTALYGAWNPEWSAEKADAVETKAFKKTLKLYSLHHAAIHKELNRLKAEGREYRIVGMAWMQGENDAAQEISARSYEANLKKLIQGYRTEFQTLDMPFVAGQINSNYGAFPEGPAMVRKAFIDVDEADENTGVIQTNPHAPWTDYPKHDDQVHYNHEGLKRLGTDMGNVLLELMK
ncbi:sialate O-acetylesterase [Pontiellaceae bacterium B12227]|nr:sialate O-acetylesterase [Pontiellaceae bacterium B12227]